MKQQIVPRTPFSTALSGSARETELRLKNIFSGPKKRPPALFLILMFAACLLCGNLVSCQVAQADEPDASAKAGQGIPVLPQEVDRAVLDRIDLDGDGLPDQLTVVTRQFEEPDGPYHVQTNAVILQAVLGGGQVLEYSWEDLNMLMVGTVTAGHLTSEDHEDVLLTFEAGYSNYAAAVVYVVRVADGKLTAEQFGKDQTTLCGACFASQENSPLDTVRIPVSAGKWEPPAWYTLRWNGTDFELSLEPDLESYSISLSHAGSLTLIPQGKTGDPFPRFAQIQVWADNVLLQTITADSVIQDGSYLFEGILDGCNALTGEPLDIRDVNFDGYQDFGIFCGTTYNGPMYWFLWDEASYRFQPGFFSSIDLRVDEEKKQLMDVWRDGNIGYDYYTYQFNGQGSRELVGHQRVDS